METHERRIVVTYKDMLRLTELTESYGTGRSGDAVDALEGELVRARMVASRDVPHDIVTMNSRVRYRDELSGRVREIVLTYPDAPTGEDRVSILSPVGSALLGLAECESIDWTMPDGKVHRLRVLEVTYQPEAAGDFEL